jgi:hypothetical protein
MRARHFRQHGGPALHVPEQYRDLENYTVLELMAYMAACYYRYFRDPEFVRQQLAWCGKQLQDTLGRDIQDRLASNGDDDNNGDYDNGYGNGDYDNGYDDESTWH